MSLPIYIHHDSAICIPYCSFDQSIRSRFQVFFLISWPKLFKNVSIIVLCKRHDSQSFLILCLGLRKTFISVIEMQTNCQSMKTNNRPINSSNDNTEVQNSSVSCNSVIEFDQLSSRLIVTAISFSKRLLLLISYLIWIAFQFPVSISNSLPEFCSSSLQ